MTYEEGCEQRHIQEAVLRGDLIKHSITMRRAGYAIEIGPAVSPDARGRPTPGLTLPYLQRHRGADVSNHRTPKVTTDTDECKAHCFQEDINHKKAGNTNASQDN